MTAVFNAIISFLEKIGLIYDPSVAPQFASNGEPFYISFEGLHIGQFRMNPVAINIGNGIRFYGIIITIGMMVALYYLCKRARAYGYIIDDLIDFFLFVVPVGVLGARLFYVFTSEGYNLSNWYRIWDGGLAIYGGIIAGAIMLYIVARFKKVRILRLMDCAAPCVMIAQAIGRWGNFCNGEAFGAATDSLFRMGLSHTEGGAQVFVHPTFLYESLWNVAGFVLINIFFKKKKFDGQIVLEYVGWYGLGRFFIELLRQDSLPLKIGSYNLRISSVIGLLCFEVCLTLFIIFIRKEKSPKLALSSYYPGSKHYQPVSESSEGAEEGENATGAADLVSENGVMSDTADPNTEQPSEDQAQKESEEASSEQPPADPPEPAEQDQPKNEPATNEENTENQTADGQEAGTHQVGDQKTDEQETD